MLNLFHRNMWSIAWKQRIWWVIHARPFSVDIASLAFSFGPVHRKRQINLLALILNNVEENTFKSLIDASFNVVQVLFNMAVNIKLNFSSIIWVDFIVVFLLHLPLLDLLESGVGRQVEVLLLPDDWGYLGS